MWGALINLSFSPNWRGALIILKTITFLPLNTVQISKISPAALQLGVRLLISVSAILIFGGRLLI